MFMHWQVGRGVSKPQVTGDRQGFNGRTVGGIPFLFCLLDTSQPQRTTPSREKGRFSSGPPASTGHTPGLVPPKPDLEPYLPSKAPSYLRPHPSIPSIHHSHRGGDPFSNPVLTTVTPDSFLNGRAPKISFPPSASDPARGSPFPHPNQLGTHPKASRRELTGGKGGGGGGSQRAQPGWWCNGFRPVTILALGPSHCAKPNLPGTKMAGRNFDVKEPRRARSSGCAGEPEKRQRVTWETGAFSLVGPGLRFQEYIKPTNILWMFPRTGIF